MSADTRTVVINDRIRAIGNNLHGFLRRWAARVRSDQEETGDVDYLWIDQLSINQDDLLEKSAQVASMGEIYARAVITIMWLGDHPNGNVATNAIPKACRTMPGGTSPYLTIKEQKAIYELLCRDYFTRHWILQEVVLSARRIIWYGPALLDFRIFQRSFSSHHERIKWINGSIMAPILQLTNLCHVHDCRQRAGRGISDVLWQRAVKYALTTKCHDLRDKIYGMQSIFDPNMRLEVEYAKSARDLFLDAVLRYYRTILRSQIVYMETLVRLGRSMGFVMRDHQEISDTIRQRIEDRSDAETEAMLIELLDPLGPAEGMS